MVQNCIQGSQVSNTQYRTKDDYFSQGSYAAYSSTNVYLPLALSTGMHKKLRTNLAEIFIQDKT